MDSSGGKRVITSTAVAVALAGLALTGRGLLRNDLPDTTAGACLILTALAVDALILIRSWITDTSEARKSLAASQREAESERSRYVALKAALEGEHGRVSRDMASARQRMAHDLVRERERIAAEFEEKRAELVSQTMETTFLMIRNGDFAPETSTTTGQVIRFPRQERAAAPQRERSREHGHVGP